MILTILGVNGPFPAVDGACSGYLLSSDSGNTNLLIDCGSGVLGRLSGVCDLAKLNAVALTHLHYDHMSDMLPLQYALDFLHVESLKVICPKTPARARSLLDGGRLDVYETQDMQIGEMKVEFLPVRHPVEAYAVRVFCDGAKFAFTGDTNVCDALSLFADGADLLLADAGLLEADWNKAKPHLTPGLCGLLARETRAQQLILTHLSPLYNPEAILEEAETAFPGAKLAQPGMRVRV